MQITDCLISCRSRIVNGLPTYTPSPLAKKIHAVGMPIFKLLVALSIGAVAAYLLTKSFSLKVFALISLAAIACIFSRCRCRRQEDGEEISHDPAPLGGPSVSDPILAENVSPDLRTREGVIGTAPPPVSGVREKIALPPANPNKTAAKDGLPVRAAAAAPRPSSAAASASSADDFMKVMDDLKASLGSPPPAAGARPTEPPLGSVFFATAGGYVTDGHTLGQTPPPLPPRNKAVE